MPNSQPALPHELIIEGMSCGHCVMAVKKQLGLLPGVTVESVEIGKARIIFDEAKVPHGVLASAIEAAGFRLAGVH
jgi:copper chaperone